MIAVSVPDQRLHATLTRPACPRVGCRALLAVAVCAALCGCTSVIPDPAGGTLATCYSSPVTAFCRVVAPKGNVVVSGTAPLGVLSGAVTPALAVGAVVAK